MTLTQFLCEDEGATAVEYGLISSLITLVCLGSLTAVGSGLNVAFHYLADGLSA